VSGLEKLYALAKQIVDNKMASSGETANRSGLEVMMQVAEAPMLQKLR
jgi:hypothetical protein